MKKVITVVFNTENEARFTRLESDRAQSRIYSLRVAEVADPGTPQERERPLGGWRISLAAPYVLEVSRARFRHSSLVERTNRSAGITILRPHRRQDHPDTLASVEPDHCQAPLRVAIADQQTTGSQHSNFGPPRLQFDHEHGVERHEPANRPDLCRGEVGSNERGPMAEKNLRQVVGRSPLGGMPSALRMLAIVDQATRWPHTLQRTLDPRVTPARIVGRHADHQMLDSCRTPRSAGALPGVGHFRATKSRRHRRIVSGVTSVANSCNLWRRRRCPSTVRRRAVDRRPVGADGSLVATSSRDSLREGRRSRCLSFQTVRPS